MLLELVLLGGFPFEFNLAVDNLLAKLLLLDGSLGILGDEVGSGTGSESHRFLIHVGVVLLGSYKREKGRQSERASAEQSGNSRDSNSLACLASAP